MSLYLQAFYSVFEAFNNFISYDGGIFWSECVCNGKEPTFDESPGDLQNFV
ncbi:3993_t:CDS:2 [Funneliformis caledonium]|uniref:3993_t:CDS:1 n=1 Tax=Funneliformis caledonium TaxID=1117310 RepID=A0A9N9FNX6_9GLOM|nr:3993_t:CDS:2 [Funneliformis caledonium]